MRTKTFLLTAALGLTAAYSQADLVISSFNTPVEENFNTFTGTGFSPTPAAGQLDSNTWRVTDMSDGSGTFGGTHTGGDFARGASTGGVTTGGTYAFDVGSGDIIIGFQPAGSDFTPGTLTTRLLNSTGATITSLSISYDIFTYNDQGRANSFNFAHSADDIAYTQVASLDFTTPEAADASPAWTSVNRAVTLNGLNIANGENFFLQWQSNDVSGGGSRDEFGLNNLSATAIPEPGTLALVGLFGLAVYGFRKRK